MGLFFFKNATQGGNWIIQERLENDAFVTSLLPENAPLSTMRVISASRQELNESRQTVPDMAIYVKYMPGHQYIIFIVNIWKHICPKHAYFGAKVKSSLCFQSRLIILSFLPLEPSNLALRGVSILPRSPAFTLNFTGSRKYPLLYNFDPNASQLRGLHYSSYGAGHIQSIQCA